jgi:hypothetical protein
MPQKLIVLSMFSLSSIFAKSQPLAPKPEARVEQAPVASVAGGSSVLAFASDTQAPMWVETIVLKANKNRTATKMVFNNILDAKPASLFLLGDVVNLGYSNRQWKPMDKYLDELRSNHISVNAILGNHEVMGRPKKGQEKFQERFPNHEKTGYVEVVDSVAVVLLNSNFNSLTLQENEKQVDWYKKTLNSLDEDSSIKFIITACHHSPFTNSKVVGQCTPVQQKFVPFYLASKKSRLFLSGHCHGFEHYQVKGKDFFVIGGGGGLHQPLRTGQGCLPDLAEDYKPQFHYLTVKRNEDELEVTSFELKNDFTGFEEGRKFRIGSVDAETPKMAVAATGK